MIARIATRLGVREGQLRRLGPLAYFGMAVLAVVAIALAVVALY